MRVRENSAKAGNTPVVYDDFSKAFLKLECNNPSGSHKDRETLYILSKYGWDKKYIIASSGNAGISLAYWMKRNATVLVPSITPREKIEAIRKLGAKVIVVGKYYEETYLLVDKFAKERNLLNISPGFVERWRGDMSISYELKDLRLDYVFVPSANCTLAYGIALGFKEMFDKNEINYLPTIVACVVPNHPFLRKTCSLHKKFREEFNSIYTHGNNDERLEKEFPKLSFVKFDSARNLGVVLRLVNRFPRYDPAVYLAIYVAKKYSGRKAVIVSGCKR